MGIFAFPFSCSGANAEGPCAGDVHPGPEINNTKAPELQQRLELAARAERGPKQIPAQFSGPSFRAQMAWTPVLGNLKLPAPFKIFLALSVGGKGKGFGSSPDDCLWATAAWRLVLSAGPLKARPWEERKMYEEAGVPDP